MESSFRPLFFKALWSAMGTDKQLWKQHIDPNVKKIGYLPSFSNEFKTLQLLNPTML